MFNVMCLHPSQITHCQDKGFVASPRALFPAAAELLQPWTTELSGRPEAPGQHWDYHEVSKLNNHSELINRIENKYPFHDGCRELGDYLAESVGGIRVDAANRRAKCGDVL